MFICILLVKPHSFGEYVSAFSELALFQELGVW